MIGKWTGNAVEDKFEIGRLVIDVERLKAENEKLSKPQTCESLGYHICGSGNVEGKLREALGLLRKHHLGTQLIIKGSEHDNVMRVVDEALKGGE